MKINFINYIKKVLNQKNQNTNKLYKYTFIINNKINKKNIKKYFKKMWQINIKKINIINIKKKNIKKTIISTEKKIKIYEANKI